MLKAALQWVRDQAKPILVNIENRQYSTQAISPVKEPEPELLQIHTLTGLVDYIKAHQNLEHLQDLDGECPFFRVISHKEVILTSGLFGEFRQRNEFIRATLPEAGGFNFGRWMDLESFVIALQSCFEQDDKAKDLLRFVASIREEHVRTSNDDGISQQVVAKKGVALVEETKVPNPVSLKPYRTFIEIDQPTISCVFRLRGEPLNLSLHEADGGLWRSEAIKSIKEYLEKAMAEINQNIPVIA